MAKSFSELQTLAIQIRDELNKKKNSAQRVGSALLDIIDNCIQNITDIKQKLSVFEHACSGFKRVSSEAQLPVTPSQEDLAKGFLVNTSLYLYVGTGGNAVNGRYFNVGDIRGPQGEPGSKGETGNTGPTGEKGEQGNSGVTGDTSDIVVINNLDGGESEEGSIKVLAAEQGKVLNKKFTELDKDLVKSIINYSQNAANIESLKSSLKEVLDDEFAITDKSGNVILRVNSSGINYVGREDEVLSLKTIIKTLKSVSTENESNFVITDFIGNVIAAITEKGLRTVDANLTSADDFYITDKNGNIAFSVTNNGVNFVGKGESAAGTSIMEGNYPSDIVMNILYGQSLTQQGSYSGKEDLYSILSFKNGNSLTGLTNPDEVEACNTYFGSQFIASKNTGLATAMGFTNKVWMELLKKENGINISMKEGTTPYFDFQLIGSVPGNPGDSWASLVNPDGVQYKRLLKSVEYARNIALSNNCTFRVGILSWMQGENSSDKVNSLKLYYDKLWIIFSNLNTDIKSITGQEEDVRFITYQMASHKSPTQVESGATDGTPLALLQIGLDKGLADEGYELETSVKSYLRTTLMNRDFIFAGPTLYPYEHQSDGVHMVNNSYHKVGALFGVISKRIITDKKEWMPIYPISHTSIKMSDNKYLLVLKFNVPTPPLAFDFTNVKGEQPNYGFSIKNNSQQEIIESVSLKRDDTINILCKENPNSLYLYYAESGTQGGGNLRDSQGNAIITDINGQPYACHNWAPIFKYQLN